jgi:hypothetical protein
VNEEHINCTKHTKGEEVYVVCENEDFFPEENLDVPGSPAFFRDLFLSIFFVLTAGMYIPTCKAGKP